MLRIGHVPKSLCTELNMSRNGVYRSGHVPKRPACPAQNSGNSSLIAMSPISIHVYRESSHFKVSNVNEVDIFYGIVLIQLA